MQGNISNVKELFLAVLDMPAGERSAYLDATCAGDAALRGEVEAMLRCHANSGELLARPAAEMLQDSVPDTDVSGSYIPEADPSATLADSPRAESSELPFLTPSTKPDLLGQLGPYEVQSVLGKGGFGVVLKAFDQRLHRVVAIKVLAPAYAAIGSARKRFGREARAAAAVKNEHVVGIHDVHGDTDPPYLVMEFIDGISLQDKIDKHGCLGLTEILRIGMQIAAGLAAAHDQGLVHRDIKPANILLENGVERVKITDFGLARTVDDASVTQSGTVAGTPLYMSPEQADGLQIDHRSDLFSLGTVLYAMCTGHPPFRATGTVAVLKRVVEDTPRPIREINNEIPDWLCDIVGRLHAKKPADRFQSAKEVAELLGQRLADVQSGREIQRAEPRKGPGTTTETPATGPLTRHGSPRRRVALAAALVCLAGGTVLGYFLWQRLAVPRGDEGTFEAMWIDDTLVATLSGKDGIPHFLKRGVPISMPPGEYQFSVHKDDEGVFYRRVQIEAGKTQKLTVAERGTLSFQTIDPTLTVKVDLIPWPSIHDKGKHVFAQTLPVGWHVCQVTDGAGKVVWESKKVVGGDITEIIDIEKMRRLAAEANDTGWVQLFNGKDLKDWTVRDTDNWKVEQGNLVGTGKNSYIETKRSDLRSFHLRAELKVEHDGECGILFRGAPGDDSGFEVTDTGTLWRAGDIVASSRPAAQIPKKSLDGVVRLEVIVDRAKIEVKVNGQTTVYTHDVLHREHDRAMPIAIKSRERSLIRIQKIEIKELPPEEPGWVQLFNGKDLTGWTTHSKEPGRNWQVEDGALFLKDGDLRGHLFTERDDFQDVHVRIEAKCSSNVVTLAAIAPFRFDESGRVTGCFGAQLGGRGIFGPFRYMDFSKDLLITPDGWFTQEVILKGNVLDVKVNGVGVSQLTVPKREHQRGRIVISAVPNAARFRKIEIKELPPGPADDLERLQGLWHVESIEMDGKLLPSKVIDKNTWRFQGNEVVNTIPKASKTYAFTLNTVASPKRIDIAFNKAKPALGIYRFDGERLVICLDEGGERPTEFTSKGGTRRELKVLRRTPAPEPGWFPLFNGKDLAGWTNPKKNLDAWKVEKGILIGKGGNAFLRSERGPFADFHLHMEAKYHIGAGLFVREQTGKAAGSGYYCTMDNNNTGAVCIFPGKNLAEPFLPKQVLTANDKWFTLEVIARGNRVHTFVDGKKAVEFVDIDNLYNNGFIAFNIYGKDEELHVKKVAITELPPEPGPKGKKEKRRTPPSGG